MISPGPLCQGPGGRAAARPHREAERLDLGQVAHVAVDDEAGDAAMLRLGADEVAQSGVHARAAGVDDDDVTRLRDVQRLVHHEIVGRMHLDRAGRARPPCWSGPVRQRMAGVNAYRRLSWSEMSGVSNARELAHELGVEALERLPDAEAGAGDDLRRLRLVHFVS